MANLEFENQRPDEEIVLIRRRHPWVLAKYSLSIIGVILVTIAAFLIWGASTMSAVFLVLAVVYIIFSFWTRWFIYNNDIFILTNQRIINIDQRGFFSRRVSEAELDNIQNATYEIKGIIKSFLNFGDIEISTAGPTSSLTLKNVENPHFVQEKIISLQNDLKK